MGGVFVASISAEHREGAGLKAGDEVDVDLELDTEPREVDVPPSLVDALDRDAGAQRYFEGLSYSNKLRLVIPIEQAKTDEARWRRISTTVSMLREGRT
ncbi:MAG: YdeI/OmpD-associated family protein [Chloroflexota bacterium]